MKSRLKTMIAILLTVCFLASGCTTNPKSSQNSSTNSTNKTATEATESSSEKNSEDSENVPSDSFFDSLACSDRKSICR